MGVRTFCQQFGVYSEWSLRVLALPPLLAVLIFCLVILGIEWVRQKPLRSELWRRHYWLVLTQLLFFPAIIAIGVLYPSTTTWPNPQPNATGNLWLNVLFYGSLLMGVFWVCKMKGLRWFAASLVGLQQVVLFGAAFIAGMSVTGEWL
jgi:hypothetical protein